MVRNLLAQTAAALAPNLHSFIPTLFDTLMLNLRYWSWRLIYSICFCLHSQSRFVFCLYFSFAEITKTFCKKVKQYLSLLLRTFKFQLIFSYFTRQLKRLPKQQTSVHLKSGSKFRYNISLNFLKLMSSCGINLSNVVLLLYRQKTGKFNKWEYEE